MADCNKESLGRLVYTTARGLHNFAEKLLKPFELTMEQFHILKVLVAGSGASQKVLGEIADKTPANMTRILDRMEAKGLISRKGDPDDRRSTLVYLTEKGGILLEAVLGEFNIFSKQIVAGIDQVDQHIAKKVLLKITDNLSMMVEESTKITQNK